MEKRINGKNVNFRDAEVDDAEFILSLRTDEKKNKYLNKTDNDLEKQRKYILDYKQKNEGYYFIIESKDKVKLGTIRIYDIQGDSFCWGSWLITANAPSSTAIESALLIYEYAFYKLNFTKVHFDVRKENERVVSFHKRFGARVVDENVIDYFFNFSKDEYEIIKEKYKKFLP